MALSGLLGLQGGYPLALCGLLSLQGGYPVALCGLHKAPGRDLPSTSEKRAFLRRRFRQKKLPLKNESLGYDGKTGPPQKEV